MDPVFFNEKSLSSLQEPWLEMDPLKVQVEVNLAMRIDLVEWMAEVCNELGLESQVFCLAVSLLDRFLCKVSVSLAHLQLLGVSCLLVAWKVRGRREINIEELIRTTADTLHKQEILEYEMLLLTKLNWNLPSEVSIDYVPHILKKLDLSVPEGVLVTRVESLLQTCCIHPNLAVRQPKLLAAAAIITVVRPLVTPIVTPAVIDTPPTSYTSSSQPSTPSTPSSSSWSSLPSHSSSLNLSSPLPFSPLTLPSPLPSSSFTLHSPFSNTSSPTASSPSTCSSASTLIPSTSSNNMVRDNSGSPDSSCNNSSAVSMVGVNDESMDINARGLEERLGQVGLTVPDSRTTSSKKSIPYSLIGTQTKHRPKQSSTKLDRIIRTIQKLTLTESSKLNEILEDIQNLICSKAADQRAQMPTCSSDLPSNHLTVNTPSPETCSFLSESMINVKNQPMHFSTPDKTADPVKTSFSMPTTSTFDPTAKNLLVDFETPTKVLDVSDYS